MSSAPRYDAHVLTDARVDSNPAGENATSVASTNIDSTWDQDYDEYEDGMDLDEDEEGGESYNTDDDDMNHDDDDDDDEDEEEDDDEEEEEGDGDTPVAPAPAPPRQQGGQQQTQGSSDSASTRESAQTEMRKKIMEIQQDTKIPAALKAKKIQARLILFHCVYISHVLSGATRRVERVLFPFAQLIHKTLHLFFFKKKTGADDKFMVKQAKSAVESRKQRRE